MVAEAEGPVRALLLAERTALNFLQRLSGTATLTRKYVEAVKDFPCKVLDTRKTTPGLRTLEKYAVRMGGGTNHRIGLYDAALVKDNHIEATGSIAEAVKAVRRHAPFMAKVEVEAGNLKQVQEAIDAGADVIMLDNMTIAQMAEAVRLVNKRAWVEASGGITLNTIRQIAETGVDFISSGALTHSAPVVDFNMKITMNVPEVILRQDHATDPLRLDSYAMRQRLSRQRLGTKFHYFAEIDFHQHLRSPPGRTGRERGRGRHRRIADRRPRSPRQALGVAAQCESLFFSHSPTKTGSRPKRRKLP